MKLDMTSETLAIVDDCQKEQLTANNLTSVVPAVRSG